MTPYWSYHTAKLHDMIFIALINSYHASDFSRLLTAGREESRSHVTLTSVKKTAFNIDGFLWLKKTPKRENQESLS